MARAFPDCAGHRSHVLKPHTALLCMHVTMWCVRRPVRRWVQRPGRVGPGHRHLEHVHTRGLPRTRREHHLPALRRLSGGLQRGRRLGGWGRGRGRGGRVDDLRAPRVSGGGQLHADGDV
jgi:hypothetical protein